MIHNMWFNTTTGQKKPYYQTLHEEEWWDNGTLPIWITAQRQVGARHLLRRDVAARHAAAVSMTTAHWIMKRWFIVSRL